MNNTTPIIKFDKAARQSSIELLKIIGIFLIVVSHVVETLNNPNPYISYNDYIVPLGHATHDPQKLCLSLLRYCGDLGNMIFFGCSAWFLIDSTKSNKKKMFHIVLNIWTISILFAIVITFLRHGDVSKGLLIKQALPIMFENNWYMTCYILFYPIHPLLNLIINKMSQATLLKTDLALLFLYAGVNYVHHTHYFASPLIYWLTIYFTIAYVKKYMIKMQNNFKINICLVIVGLLCHCGLVIATNALGLHIGAFSDKVMKWQSYCSPFILCQVIGLINIARNINFKNSVVNKISSLSLLIYIIHENMLLRTYYRPLWWHMIYNTFGYSHILAWVFIMVILLVICSILSAFLYQITLQKLISKIGDIMYERLRKIYHNLEIKLLKFQ